MAENVAVKVESATNTKTITNIKTITRESLRETTMQHVKKNPNGYK